MVVINRFSLEVVLRLLAKLLLKLICKGRAMHYPRKTLKTTDLRKMYSVYNKDILRLYNYYQARKKQQQLAFVEEIEDDFIEAATITTSVTAPITFVDISLSDSDVDTNPRQSPAFIGSPDTLSDRSDASYVMLTPPPEPKVQVRQVVNPTLPEIYLDAAVTNAKWYLGLR